MSKIHYIKCLPEFFCKLKSGEKTFEARLNDRDYKEGDIIINREYIPAEDTYTGRDHIARAGFILYGPAYGVQDGYCIISLHEFSDYFS